MEVLKPLGVAGNARMRGKDNLVPCISVYPEHRSGFCSFDDVSLEPESAIRSLQLHPWPLPHSGD
jgi:hypothetical protein